MSSVPQLPKALKARRRRLAQYSALWVDELSEGRLLLPSCPSIEFAGGDVLSTSSASGKEVMDHRDVNDEIARSVAIAMITFYDAS